LFEIKWIFYGLSRMLQFYEFVWVLSYSVWDVFNKFLLIDATDRSKISSDQKRFFIALSLHPLSFFANTPFKHSMLSIKHDKSFILILIKKAYLWNKPVDTHTRKKMALVRYTKHEKIVGFVKVCRKMVKNLNVFFT